MNTAIIGGGIIESDFVADFIKDSNIDCIIAADKGLKFCYEQNLMPDYILGDYDSIASEILEWYQKKSEVPVTVFPAEKDDTDGALAFEKAMEIGSDRIYFLGALGGRMDHAIANIHLLKTVLENKSSYSTEASSAEIDGQKDVTDKRSKDRAECAVCETGSSITKCVEAYIVDSKNMISLVDKEKKIRRDQQFGRYVSFLPLTDVAEEVTLEGFKYPLNEYTMEKGKSIGVSNEIVDSEAKVKIKSGLLLMIQSRD